MASEKSQKAYVTDTLRDLQIAIRSSSLYSISHPTSVKVIGSAFAKLQKHFEQRESVVIQVVRGLVLFDRLPLDSNNIHVKKFLGELLERSVSGVTFQRKLALDELKSFMKIMGMKASKVVELGGIEKALLSEKVQSIRVTIFTAGGAGGLGGGDADVGAGGAGGAGGGAGAPMLPEMSAFTNFFLGKEKDLGGFTDRFLQETERNPAFMAQVLSRSVPEEAAEAGEHPIIHYLRSLDKVAEQFSQKVGDGVEELTKLVVPVAISFEPQVRYSLVTEGREYAADAGRHISKLYPGIVSELIAEQVRSDYKDGHVGGVELGEKALSFLRYADDRATAVRLIGIKLNEAGMIQDEIGDVLDHVDWGGFSIEEKFQCLVRDEKPWVKVFEKVHSTVAELITSDQSSKAVILFRAYTDGLRVSDESVRRRVAQNGLTLVRSFPIGAQRDTLSEYLATQLRDCLRSEQTSAAAEMMFKGLAGLVKDALTGTRFSHAIEAAQLIEEPLLLFDTPAWKSDLARKALREMTDQAVISSLVEHLHTADGGRDKLVADCVRRLGGSLIEGLIAQLADEEDRVKRARLVEAIQIVGPAAESAILVALSDERWYLVRNLAILLGEIGGERSIYSLEKLLFHKDQRVARTAVRSLNKIAAPTAYRVLARALERSSDDLRLNIIQTAVVAGDESMLPQLLEIARSKSPMGSGEALRKKAIEALGKVGSPQALAVLTEILEKRSLFAMAEDVDFRLCAARALGAIGGTEANDALDRAARKDPKEEVRLEARRLLGEDTG